MLENCYLAEPTSSRFQVSGWQGQLLHGDASGFRSFVTVNDSAVLVFSGDFVDFTP